jgi:flagellar hook-basal body complex protein FliE
MEINKINNYLKFNDYQETKTLETENKNNFGDFLKNAVNEVNNMQIESENYKQKLAIGEVDNLHDLSIATEKANVSLQVVMSVRNKIVEAYKEIMRIQI